VSAGRPEVRGVGPGEQQRAVPEAVPYDCQACGACCVGLDVLLDVVDLECLERMPHLVSLTVLHHSRSGLELHLMRRDAGTDRCVALAGPLAQCRCIIYDRRPALCREFAAGSPDCLEARQRVYRVG